METAYFLKTLLILNLNYVNDTLNHRYYSMEYFDEYQITLLPVKPAKLFLGRMYIYILYLLHNNIIQDGLPDKDIS